MPPVDSDACCELRTTDLFGPLIFICLGLYGLPQQFQPYSASWFYISSYLKKVFYLLLKAKILRTMDVISGASRHPCLCTWICQVDHLTVMAWRLTDFTVSQVRLYMFSRFNHCEGRSGKQDWAGGEDEV